MDAYCDFFGIILTTGHQVDQMKCKVDIAFVVDSSSSISVDDFDIQKNFIEDVVRRFDVGPEDVQFAAVSYSGNAYDEFKFNAGSDQSRVIKDVGDIRYSQGPATRTYKAIERMRTYLFAPGKGSRDDVVHVGIILTDGTTNPGKYDRLSTKMGKAATQEQAQLAKDDGIYLFAVGIGPDVNKEELLGIASVDPDNKFMITVDSYNQLNTKVVKETLSYRACSPVSSPNPVINIEQPIFPDIPQGEDPNEVCQGKPADVFFLLDESSSIHSEANFKLELKFVEHVINYLDVSADLTRVGVLTFSDTATMHFKLNDYSNKDEVESALKNIQWRGGNTYTHEALQMLRNEGFSVMNGARKGVAHIGIIVTDGSSNEPKKTSEEAEKVLNEGTYMFAIGVGSVNKVELNTLASEPNSDFVFTVKNLGALDKIKEILAYRVCKENTQETPQEICGQRTADIVFVADASTNIGQSDFDKLLGFIGEVVSQFDIGVDATRVGLITFANTSKIEFNLNSYTSLHDMKKAISNVEWRSGQRYTAEAIQTLYCKMFTPEQGARGDDVPKIGIVLTDGTSRQPKKTNQMSKAAHDLGIRVFAIGIGQYIAEDELKSLSSNLDSYFKVDDFSALYSIGQSLTSKVCQEAKPGLHQLNAFDKKELKEIKTLLELLEKAESSN
ncbi:Collagen alpha-5(VI) chain [Mizuhopecten yessoensis]|uniref:Collagen alpha-5(VI) chain n=1 Tax=Mizuhopecten yessoensis TaxID=6573 RepID=A0A210QLP2_MIZYE|nr:Collagen alpha-5(VI) chain [Mizuhopecten yessoensis]